MDAREWELLLVQMQYPAMPQLESNITRAWIRQYGRDYDSLDFNVRLGKGQDIQPGIPASTAGQFDKITRKRADIVAHAGTWVDILEVKGRASLSAIGQLIGYHQLWTDERPTFIVRRLIVVCQLIDDDVRRVFATNGIQSYVLEPEPWK
jgi:hypothetical protein